MHNRYQHILFRKTIFGLRNIQSIFRCMLLSMLVSLSARSQSASTLENWEIDSLVNAQNPILPKNQNLPLHNYQYLLNSAIANDYTKGIALSNFILGQYYVFNDPQVDSAVFYYDKTTLTIEKMGLDLKNLLALSYSQKAISLAQAGLEFLSLEFFEKAYAVRLKEGDPMEITNARVNLAELNRVLGNYDKAISLSQELLNGPNENLDETAIAILNGIIGAALVQNEKPEKALPFLEASDSLGVAISIENEVLLDTRTWTAHAYLDMKDYAKAISVCENILNEFEEYHGNLKLSYLVHGKSLLGIGQPDRGLKVLEEGLSAIGNKEDEIAILETLGKAHLAQGNTVRSQPLFSKAMHLRDSMQNARAKRFSRYSSVSYDLLETQYKNDNLAYKNESLETKALQREYTMGLLALSIVVILLAILGYLLWNKYSKGEKTIKTLQANEKSILEAHIKVREDELGATTLHLARSVETLDTIIEEYQNGLANKDYATLGRIKNMLKDHREASSATSLITERIESQYPGFSAQLMRLYPNFTANDVKHCLLLKLGLSLKETAQLLNITIAAVKSARGRMRKKMGVRMEVPLQRHLQEISKSQ